ncbi:MAG: universal stress protein [Chloroflexota bacterium]
MNNKKECLYEKILVPLDGSNLAECVLEHVREIATRCSAEVDLLFVVESISGSAGVTYAKAVEGQEKVKTWGKNYLDKVEQNLEREGVDAKSVVLERSPAEVIVDYARKNKVDLIIMSTHGRSGAARWAMGSVADKVLRSATVPVFIVTPLECRVARG